MHRRPDRLGVHSLDQFVLTVPDLEQAKHFYTTFGLDVRTVGRDSALSLHTFGHPHRWATLLEGSQKQLHHLSFGVFPEDLEQFRKHLDRLGVELIQPPDRLDDEGLWFRDHDGRAIQVRVADKSAPDEKAVFDNPSALPGARGAPLRGASKVVRPRRLAHVLLFTRDVGRAIAFYSSVLGLRLSDEAGGIVAFLHGVHGSDHHLIAFAKSDTPGFHHCSWDVGSVQDVGLGAMQMAEAGFAAGWGLGRHVFGSNYFHYVRDPWHSYCEYSADMDYIPAEMDWEGASHGSENGFYLWGPDLPSDFAVNHESGG